MTLDPDDANPGFATVALAGLNCPVMRQPSAPREIASRTSGHAAPTTAKPAKPRFYCTHFLMPSEHFYTTTVLAKLWWE